MSRRSDSMMSDWSIAWPSPDRRSTWRWAWQRRSSTTHHLPWKAPSSFWPVRVTGGWQRAGKNSTMSPLASARPRMRVKVPPLSRNAANPSGKAAEPQEPYISTPAATTSKGDQMIDTAVLPVTPKSTEELEELIGQEIGPTEWHEVTQERINAFADATGDQQWIHVDPERAKASPFGTTIAHGLYSLSLGPVFSYSLLSFEAFTHSLN